MYACNVRVCNCKCIIFTISHCIYMVFVGNIHIKLNRSLLYVFLNVINMILQHLEIMVYVLFLRNKYDIATHGNHK